MRNFNSDVVHTAIAFSCKCSPRRIYLGGNVHLTFRDMAFCHPKVPGPAIVHQLQRTV